MAQFLFGINNTSSADDESHFTLADLSQLLLEIYVDESDFSRIEIGYPVEIVFDAFPDEVFTGEVIEISPSIERVSNVDGLRAVVMLDHSSYAKPNLLPTGLSAQVEVISGQAVEAVLVPIEALVEVSPGEFIVYVIENDQPVQRIVEVGLVDFTMAEIHGGLQAGEIVALGYEHQ